MRLLKKHQLKKQALMSRTKANKLTAGSPVNVCPYRALSRKFIDQMHNDGHFNLELDSYPEGMFVGKTLEVKIRGPKCEGKFEAVCKILSIEECRVTGKATLHLKIVTEEERQ